MASIPPPPPPPPPPPLLLLLPQPNLLSLPQARSKPKRRGGGCFGTKKRGAGWQGKVLEEEEEGEEGGLLLLSLEEGSLARIHTEGGRGKKRDKSFWHQLLLLLSFFSVFQMGKERLLRFCPIFLLLRRGKRGEERIIFCTKKMPSPKNTKTNLGPLG